MRTNLIQSIGLKPKIAQLLEALRDFIVRMTDFVVYKSISFGEFILFGFAAGRAVWYLFFGVTSANFDYFFRDSIWTTYFAVSTATHLTGFFVKARKARIAAFYAYGFAWGLLAFLAFWARTNAPAVPQYLLLFVGSVFVIVRLSRAENPND